MIDGKPAAAIPRAEPACFKNRLRVIILVMLSQLSGDWLS
jgi:hypothetical protein